MWWAKVPSTQAASVVSMPLCKQSPEFTWKRFKYLVCFQNCSHVPFHYPRNPDFWWKMICTRPDPALSVFITKTFIAFFARSGPSKNSTRAHAHEFTHMCITSCLHLSIRIRTQEPHQYFPLKHDLTNLTLNSLFWWQHSNSSNGLTSANPYTWRHFLSWNNL